ncbi:Fc.00g112640.m01.CDS01 [Cosmosporella sp. VM-42]
MPKGWRRRIMELGFGYSTYFRDGKACVNCRERKVRCDALQKGIPCTNCQAQNRSGCRIYEKRKARTSLARSDRALVPIQPHDPNAVTEPSTPATVGSRSETTGIPALHSSIGGEPLEHGRRSESPSAATPVVGDCEDEQASRNLAEFIDREEIRIRVISDGSRLYFIGTEVSNLNYLVMQRSRNLEPSGLHFGSRQIARKYTAHEFKRVPSEALELPERYLADELVRVYFVHVNRGFPIVDEEDFMIKYSGDNPRNPVPLPLLHAIFLVGAHVLSPGREDVKALKPKLFHRVKMLFDSRFEQDRAMYVQVALLMTWHSDGLEDIVANSWHWVGVAVRVALGLGMHRDASQSSMAPVHKRLWVRLWWVLYQFDVLVSASYGRPQAINIEESDVQPLQPSHFEGVPETKIDFVIAHTRLCIVFSKTMKQRLSLRCTPAERVQSTQQADEALAEFITHLPSSLCLSLPEADIWQSILHLTYNNFLILLHRPPPQVSSRHVSLESASDLSICGDATVVITSIFEGLRASNALSNLWLPGVNALFTAMVHVSKELDSPNPLVAAKSLRMLDSLLLSLRVLSGHWLYAQSLLRLFEERELRYRQQKGMISSNEPVASGTRLRLTDDALGEPTGFSLRPNPLSIPSMCFPNHHSTGDTMPSSFQPSSVPPSLNHPRGETLGQSLHSGQNSPVLRLGNDASRHLGGESAETGAGDVSHGQQYVGSFFGSGLGMPDVGEMELSTLPFPEASALEFLLAGMGNNEYEF